MPRREGLNTASHEAIVAVRDERDTFDQPIGLKEISHSSYHFLRGQVKEEQAALGLLPSQRKDEQSAVV